MERSPLNGRANMLISRTARHSRLGQKEASEYETEAEELGTEANFIEHLDFQYHWAKKALAKKAE